MSSLFDYQKFIVAGKIQVRELRETTGGTSILSLSIPTVHSYKKKNSDEYEQETTWHNITIFNPNDYVKEQCQKGQPILVEGRLQKETYDKDGQTHYSIKVIADFGGVKILSPIKKEESSPDNYNHFPRETVVESGEEIF